jgi:hypothetical protein
MTGYQEVNTASSRLAARAGVARVAARTGLGVAPGAGSALGATHNLAQLGVGQLDAARRVHLVITHPTLLSFLPNFLPGEFSLT